MGAGITSTQILFWNSNDVTGSNNFTFNGTDIVTLADTGYYSGRLLGPVLLPVKAAEPLTKGIPVYVTGAVGASGVVIVAAADASNSSKMPAVGLIDATLATNDIGYAVVFGNQQKVDTSAYSINQTVFVAPGGGLTAIKPTGANDAIQNIGRVIRVGSTTGDILVSAIGRSNDVPNILQARSYLQMPDGMTATGLVRSFNGLTGDVTGVTAVNAGSGISVSGTTNPTVTNTGVLTFNGATGAVSGVNSVNGLTGALSLLGSTGISIAANGKGITFTNTGVQSFNGLTGAVSGVTQINQGTNIVVTGTTNPTVATTTTPSFSTITGTNGSGDIGSLLTLGTVSAGSPQYAPVISSNASLQLNGSTFSVGISAGTAVFSGGITVSSGGGHIVGNLRVTGSYLGNLTNNVNGATGAVLISGGDSISITTSGKTSTVTNTGVTGFNGLTGNVSGVTSVNAGSGISVSGTTNPTVTNTGVLSFNSLTGAVSGVTQINAGTGISISGTTNPTITNTGVQSFNGATGAVSGVTSTGSYSWPATQYMNSIEPYDATTISINTETSNTITQIGDVNSNGNSTYIIIDDVAPQISIGNQLICNSNITGVEITGQQFNDNYSNVRTYRTITSSTTANQTIAGIDGVYEAPDMVYPAFEATISARDTVLNKTEMLKMHIVHDGTNTVNTQYGLIRTGATGPVSSYSTTLLAGIPSILRIRATPASANNTVFTVTVRSHTV